MIPEDSIRLRIISNSNSDMDIKEKLELKSYLEDKLLVLLGDVSNKAEADNIIVNNIEEIDSYINSFLKDKPYKLSYGKNYFPNKMFKGVIYNEGYYDSLVVTIGNGKGSNWWCSLFPPLCLIDENTDDVQYKFFVSRIIDYFK